MEHYDDEAWCHMWGERLDVAHALLEDAQAYQERSASSASLASAQAALLEQKFAKLSAHEAATRSGKEYLATQIHQTYQTLEQLLNNQVRLPDHVPQPTEDDLSSNSIKFLCVRFEKELDDALEEAPPTPVRASPQPSSWLV